MFAEAREYWTMSGFSASQLLPIIPPGAVLSATSEVDPRSCGKVPGRFLRRTREWCGLTGTWASTPIAAEEIAEFARFPTAGVGIRAERFPAVDIDIDDADLVRRIEALALFMLGDAPRRSRADSPRTLRMYRTRERMPKRIVKCDVGRIEFLGAGQQYLIAGPHPAGARYEWDQDPDPLELTDIDAEAVTAFLGAVEALFAARGLHPITSSERTSTAAAASPFADQEPVTDAGTIWGALEAWRNTEATLPDRNDLVRVAARLKAALGREALTGDAEARFTDWATADGWADAEYAAKVWHSISETRVDRGDFLRECQGHGWGGAPEVEFGEMPDHAPPPVATAIEAASREFAYLATSEQWVHLGTGDAYSHSAFNNSRWGYAIKAGRKRPHAHDLMLGARLFAEVSRQTYWPGKPRVFADTDGAQCLNRWIDERRTLPARANADDVSRYLHLVTRHIPDPAERHKFLQYMAHIVQHRGEKIRWVMLITGAVQGTGKDTMIKPLVWFLGRNSREVLASDIGDQFTGFLETELLVIQEMNVKDNGAQYDKFKPVFAGSSQDKILINRKFEQPYYIPNTCNIIAMSNHDLPMFIEKTDRRFFVIESPVTSRTPMEDAYFEDLHGWLDRGGNAEVVRYLMNYDLAGFNPAGLPMMTEAKRAMIDMSRTGLADMIEDELDGGRLDGRTVLSAKEVVELARQFGTKHALASVRTAGLALRSLDWISVYTAPGVPRIWCKTPEIAGSSREMIRKRWEKEAA